MAHVSKDATYQEALLAKRIEFVQRLKADLADTNSVAAQTVAAYTDLVDGAVFAERLPQSQADSFMRGILSDSGAESAGLLHQRSSQMWQ